MTDSQCRPSPLRLVMVMLYDGLLLLSALMLATAVPVSLNEGEAIADGNPFFLIYLFMICYVFYGWFWTHGGQTLGMRTWKVYLVGQYDVSITWRQAFIRCVAAFFSLALLGVGYFGMWFGKEKLSWHDKLSGTQLILNKTSKTKD